VRASGSVDHPYRVLADAAGAGADAVDVAGVAAA